MKTFVAFESADWADVDMAQDGRARRGRRQRGSRAYWLHPRDSQSAAFWMRSSRCAISSAVRGSAGAPLASQRLVGFAAHGNRRYLSNIFA